MMNAWRQRAMRDALFTTSLVFDFPIENDETIVAAYEKVNYTQTKIIMLHISSIGLGK
jgi:hypothetical protein